MDFLNFVSLTDVQVLSNDGAFLRLESSYPHLQPAVVQSRYIFVVQSRYSLASCTALRLLTILHLGCLL